MIFVFVGRLEKIKGIDLLIQAWSQSKSHTNSQLLICGNGPLGKWCEDYVASNKIKNVKFMGTIKNREVKQLLKNADAMILPTQCYEGFPMTILESFSVATPVIVSDLGNAGSMVEPYVTGIKFKHDSKKSLSDCIDEFFNIKNINWKNNIFKIYQKDWSEDNNYKCLESIYRTIKERCGKNGIEQNIQNT